MLAPSPGAITRGETFLRSLTRPPGLLLSGRLQSLRFFHNGNCRWGRTGTFSGQRGQNLANF